LKIVYLITEDYNKESGVLRKINQQINYWRKNNNVVYKVFVKNGLILDNNDKILKKINLFQIPLFCKDMKLETLLTLNNAYYFLYKILDSLKIDLVYTRYNLFFLYFYKIIKKYKTIMEINADDVFEYKLHSNLTYYYNKIFRNFILNNVTGFVFVTNELKKRFNRFNKPSEVISNCIEVESYPFLLQLQNNRPKIVFIGSPNQPWHGISKIEEIAKYLKNYDFFIIGYTGKNKKNIFYLGYMEEKKATKIISTSDVAIGSLSMERNYLNEACPLKVRHYLACGIPIIYSYKDTDLNGNEDFALKINSNIKNEILKIDDFIKQAYRNQILRKKARIFAEEVLDCKIKENKRLKFMERILNER
jgi:hypothetical protein